MAEIKRTWSMPTSPRSPYKLPQTLVLLSEFEGQVWNRETQTTFAKKLAGSDFYEGSVPANLDFAARDRIKAHELEMRERAERGKRRGRRG